VVPDSMRFQQSADAGGADSELCSDFGHGQTFLNETRYLAAVYDQPRHASDAPLFAGLLEPGNRAFAYPVGTAN